MSEAAVATRIPAEYRFPLHLEPSVATVWELYNLSKQSIWDPGADLPWNELRSADYTPEALAAARLAWSHRVWWLYGRLTETPALLVRFCLERQRESDPKYFLAMRGSQDAWHVEACQRMAAALGGLITEPKDSGYAARFNAALSREVLDAELSLDSHVAAHGAFRDGLEAELLRAAEQSASNGLAKATLARLRVDRERQSQFGWLYLRERAATWGPEERAAIAARIDHCRRRFVASGVMLPGLGAAPADLLSSYEVAAEAGLGGILARDAVAAQSSYLTMARKRFAAWQIEMA